jgi:hypothetical protein
VKVIIGLGVALALTQLSADAQIDVTTDSGDTVQLGPGGVSIQTRYGKQVDLKAPTSGSTRGVARGRSVSGTASTKTAEQNNATNRTKQKNSSSDPAQLPAKVQALLMLSGGAAGTSRKPLPKVIDVSVDDIILYDNNINQTLTCTNNGVVVQGSHCSLSIIGNCRVLSITGNFNTVRCENVGAISVPGSHNTIYWAKGLNGRKQPTVSVSGNSNSCSSVKQP